MDSIVVVTVRFANMRFVLHYRGRLRANGTPAHKHELRQIFHQQLKRLWGTGPLLGYEDLLAPRRSPGSYCLLRELAPFTFAPLVTAEMSVVAELSLVLLRPEPAGQLITTGGDIDNRLKTLFDALTMPRQANALPSGSAPTSDEAPFFCLLEDDNLVTSVSVRTEHLLEDVEDRSIVDLTVAVYARAFKRTIGNSAFGS